MNFLLLALAILSEVTGTTALKFSQGFTRPLPSVFVVIGYALSFYLLSLTLKKMDIGLVYAIWSAAGTALVATIGVLWFKEPMNLFKLISLALIIFGVIGLNLSGASH